MKDFSKKLDELSGGLVRSALDAEEFSGKEGETAYFHLVGNNKLKARRLLLVGVGDASDYKTAQVSQMAGTAVRSLRSKNAKSIAIVPRATGMPRESAAAAVEGAFIAYFDPDKYRTVDKEQEDVSTALLSPIDGAEGRSTATRVESGSRLLVSQ